jgi:hypothetical protein
MRVKPCQSCASCGERGLERCDGALAARRSAIQPEIAQLWHGWRGFYNATPPPKTNHLTFPFHLTIIIFNNSSCEKTTRTGK